MDKIAGFPYTEVEIEKSGQLKDSDDIQRVITLIKSEAATDLLILSHGWNNDMDEARTLYSDLLSSMRDVVDRGFMRNLKNRSVFVVGILWPSKKFAEEDLIPGGAAAAGDAEDATIDSILSKLNDGFDSSEASSQLGEARLLLSDLERDPATRDAFVDIIRGLLPADEATSEDGSDNFFSKSGQELFRCLDAPFLPIPIPRRSGGAAGGVGADSGSTLAGGAAGLGDLGKGVKSAARRILNYTTYYLMKARAGRVGATGVKQLVEGVRDTAGNLKVHLVGHSFGGRVVTSAAQVLGDSPASRPNSMALLQAAFSHNGFAKDFHAGEDGFFRSIVSGNKVSGPILITHTHRDKANLIAYPIASRLAGQDAAALNGGPKDRYGAIGANGAQHTPEATALQLIDMESGSYNLEPGNVYNLNSDKFVAGHGDVTGHEIAFAILSGMAVT